MDKKRILIVDDELELLEAMTARLTSEGYDVSVALDGERGLEKLLSEKIDLIILDIGMPNMDGYTLTKKIKANDDIKSIPIIILTARDSMQDLFASEGITDYIVKPFDYRDLLNRMSRLLKEE
jgi:two-component system response regulator CpxR